ncbi:uncharacterized protein LOC114461079 [Gouania willdenowi]|uniref:uncharacterized protein LOC114461079 n=1 Tax=Gouania willdenowi TaxID=441366 RepID=UPI0010550C27|nr:uncharacterized protein LOC114461079 [Gouania willdenowi]
MAFFTRSLQDLLLITAPPTDVFSGLMLSDEAPGESHSRRPYSPGRTSGPSLWFQGRRHREFLLVLPTCNVGNAENLYEKLSEALRKRGIPWENLIAFNSDNASVMKGRHNSVLSRLKISQPHVQDLGCICHLVQLATGCGITAAQLLRYCSTRWLSLITCLQRVLNQWDALQAYFNSHEEVERSAKVHDLARHLRDPIVKTYFLFLSAARLNITPGTGRC